MLKILVNRPKGDVYVSIMLDRSNNKYRFVNLTKGHICTCLFDNIEDAINDLKENIKNGEVNSYRIIEK